MALPAHRNDSSCDQSEIFELGSFITKGYGPKSAVDIDMFAGENQSLAYLSDVDMERIGIKCVWRYIGWHNRRGIQGTSSH